MWIELSVALSFALQVFFSYMLPKYVSYEGFHASAASKGP